MERKSVISILLGLALVILTYLILAGYFTRQVTREVTRTIIDTVYVEDTVTISKYVKDMDTVTQVVDSTKRINLDSLWEEAKEYWNAKNDSTQKNYIASKDTLVKDSLVSVKVSVSSPIPLHPLTTVNTVISYKIPTVTITKYVEVLPLLTYGLTVSAGYALFNGKADILVGVGINLNLGRLF